MSRGARAAALAGVVLAAAGCATTESASQPVLGSQSPAPVASPSPTPMTTAPQADSPGVTVTPSRGTATPRQTVTPVPAVIQSTPGTRIAAAMVTQAHDLLLYGGGDLHDNAQTDTWRWDGHRWTKLSDAGPTSAYGPSLALDPLTRTPLLLPGGPAPHEGATDQNFGGPTWRWTGTRWQQLHPAHSLVNGSVVSTVADAAHHRLLAYVSTTVGDMASGNNADYLASMQMWAWDGRDWSKLYAHAADGHYDDPAAVVVGPSGSILGVGNGMYGWTGHGWRQLSATGAPIEVSAASYDPQRHLVVVVGATARRMPDEGIADDGTYLYDGTHWRRQSLPSALATREGSVSGWDAVDDGVLVGFGEQSHGNINAPSVGYSDAWLFTASGWRQLSR